MKRHVTGKNGRQIINALSKPWSTNPWLSVHRVGADHGYRIDGGEHPQGSQAVLPQAREYWSKPKSGQSTALNRWEDDGGSAAAVMEDVCVSPEQLRL
jgi:hypothetical protein